MLFDQFTGRLNKIFMPFYTTTIKLMSGTTEDYEKLSDELKKKSFTEYIDRRGDAAKKENAPVILSTNQANLFDVTASVSSAASSTGKKFSFTVRKEKTV
jgi:hypothetical protein